MCTQQLSKMPSAPGRRGGLGRRLAAVVTGALLVSASPVAAKELRVVYGGAPDGYAEGAEFFAARINERLEGYTAKTYVGALLSYAETLTGLRDGVADVGFVVAGYHRGELRYTNLITDMAMAAAESYAATGAVCEYLMTCEACLKEFNALGQITLGASGLPAYQLTSAPLMRTPEQFQGKKVRSFSAFGRWAESLGATQVTISINDTYEAMNQGHIDATLSPAVVAKALSLGDSADYLLALPTGSQLGNHNFNIGLHTWNAFTEAQKRTVIDIAAESFAYGAVRYWQDNQEVIRNPGKYGVELVQPSPELVAATDAFRKSDMATVARLNREEHGIEDAAERVERFVTLIEKWNGLIAGIDRNDHEALAAVYKREIFDKLDPAALTP